MKSYFDVDPKAPHWKRLQKLQEVKGLSSLAKQTDLAKLEPQALRVMEDAILKEARANAATSGRLFRTAERDRGGRMVEKFEGDPKAWMKPFMAPGVHVRFNREAGTHEETIRVRDGQRAVAI